MSSAETKPTPWRSIQIDGEPGKYSVTLRKPIFRFEGGYAVMQPILMQAGKLTARFFIYRPGQESPEVMNWPEFQAFYEGVPGRVMEERGKP